MEILVHFCGGNTAKDTKFKLLKGYKNFKGNLYYVAFSNFDTLLLFKMK